MCTPRFFMSSRCLYFLLGVLCGPSKVVGENAAVPVSATTNTSTMMLQVLEYNVFGRPNILSRDGQRERLERIPESLIRISDTIDVVTLVEAFDETQRDDMLGQFRKFGFHYVTSILHDPDPVTSFLNGGVMVVSKWPIVREAQHVYRNACHYPDCLAAKGVKYARILKTVDGASKVFNVFATHMQAWSTPEGRSDRMEQAKQMRQFVDAISIPYHEPLILAGDFNVDSQNFGDELAQLLVLLQAHEPRRIGKQNFTSDPHTNVLVGRDGAADNCSAQYVHNWGPVKDGVFHPSLATRSTCLMNVGIGATDNMCYCPCCPFEWLDYILYGKDPYQQPSTMPTIEAYVNQVPHFTADWTALDSSMKMALVDLSDHYPVLAKYEFPMTRGKGKDDDPLTYHLDGCSKDDDCHFHSSDCYCTGQNCYYEGNYISGSKLDSKHPVNRNCLYQETAHRCLCGPT